jgi:teichuronic acid biosynthesis protein TuaE
VISPSSWRSRLAEHKRVIAPWLLFTLTVAAAGAAVFASPVFVVVPIAVLPVVATWAYPKSIWPFFPLTTIVISPSIFLVNGEPFPYDEAVQKAILIIAGLCLALALGLRWSWVGAAAMAVVGLAGLATILNIGGRVEVTSHMPVFVRATVGYCVPFLFFFINWRRLNLQKGLEYLATLPLMCLIAGVVLQIAGVKGPPYRAPFPGIYCIDHGVPRLQGALIAPHLAELALVALAAALCLSGSPNADRGYRIHLWVALNFVILMATVTRSEIAIGMVLILTYLVGALGRNRLRTLHGRRAIWPIAAIAVVSCAIAAPALITRTTGSRYEGTFNTSGRTYAWEFFQGFVAENPLTGKGLGFASIAVKLYMSAYMSESFVETFRTPHNEYLRWLVDGGIFFALGLFLVILSAFVIAARAQRGAVRALVAVFALGTVAISYVDNTFSTVQFSVPVVILLGLLAAHPGSGTKLPGKHRAKTRDRGDDSFLEETDPAPGSGADTPGRGGGDEPKRDTLRSEVTPAKG